MGKCGLDRDSLTQQRANPQLMKPHRIDLRKGENPIEGFFFRGIFQSLVQRPLSEFLVESLHYVRTQRHEQALLIHRL